MTFFDEILDDLHVFRTVYIFQQKMNNQFGSLTFLKKKRQFLLDVKKHTFYARKSTIFCFCWTTQQQNLCRYCDEHSTCAGQVSLVSESVRWTRRPGWCANTDALNAAPRTFRQEASRVGARAVAGSRRRWRRQKRAVEQEAVDVSMEVFMVLSQDTVRQRYVEQIIDDVKVGLASFDDASWTSKRPASESDVGLVVPFSDVLKFARAVLPGKLEIISTISFSGRHCPRVHATVHGGSPRKLFGCFHVVSRILSSRSSHLKIWIFSTSPLYVAVTRPRCVSLRRLDEFQ